MTVWLVSLFFESSLVQLLQAKAANINEILSLHCHCTVLPAYEALRVELPEHGSDAAARDWLATHGTQ